MQSLGIPIWPEPNQLLRVRKRATAKEVELAYKALSMELHPDKHPVQKFLDKHGDIVVTQEIQEQVENALEKVWGTVQAYKENMVQWDVDYFRVVFQEPLHTRMKPDEWRCHDPYVLQWIANQEYEAIITDFSMAKDGSPLSYAPGIPPHAKVDLEEAKRIWPKFWEGECSIQDLQAHFKCQNICMVAPERSKEHLLVCHQLMRDLLELWAKEWFQPWKPVEDWKFSLLMNIHRFPISHDTEEEDVHVGLNFVEQIFLVPAMWNFVHNIHVLRPTKHGQFGVGWNAWTPVQRSSYYILVEFTNQCDRTRWLVENMHKGKMITKDDFQVPIHWGTMRANMEHLEFLMNTQGEDLCPIIPTWRYLRPRFPCMKLHGPSPKDSVGGLEASTGFRLSVDVHDQHKGMVGPLLQKFSKHPTILANWSSRRSFGNWSPDKLQAWDITLLVDTWEEGFPLAMELWEELKPCWPFLGFYKMLNWDLGRMVLLEYTQSMVLHHRSWGELLRWILFVSLGMAICFSPALQTLEDFDKLLDVVQSINQESYLQAEGQDRGPVCGQGGGELPLEADPRRGVQAEG